MSSTPLPQILKLWIFSFLIVACRANPVAIVLEDDPDASPLRMTGERVHLSISRESTLVTGTYQFALEKSETKAPYLLIRLPVYVAHPTETTDFHPLNTLYAPELSLGETRFTAHSVENGQPAWRSFWRGAKFFHADFIFRIPASLVSEKFFLQASYQQPHMIARGKKYACYCPFIPQFDGKVSDWSDWTTKSDAFVLRATVTDASKLKRVSKNSLVFSESPQALEVWCYDHEEIVLLVTPAVTPALSPAP